MCMAKEKKFTQKRKWWYRGLKKMMKSRYKKPEFIYLGEKPTNSSIILSCFFEKFGGLQGGLRYTLIIYYSSSSIRP